MSEAIKSRLSIIRVISMIMIVTCHILQFYGIKLAFWINVGVQLFFIMSGFLYGCKDVKDFKAFWIKKIYRIILPYEFIIIVFFVVSFILKKNISVMDMVYYLTASQAFNTSISSIAHLWFISYILLFYLLIPFLQKFDISKKDNFWLIFTAIIAFMQFLQFANIVNINITYLMLFIGAYYISRRLYKHKIPLNFNKLITCSLIICLIGIPLQLFLEAREFTGIMYKLFILYCDYIHAFLGIVLFYFFIRYLPIIKNKCITYLEKYSFSIYLVHQIFILGFYSVLNYRNGLIYAIILIALCSLFINKLFDYIYKRRLGNGK